MILFLTLLACAPSLDPGDKDDTGSGSEVTPGDAVLDATSQSDWVFLDLETAAVVTPEDPADSPAWDLGFRRYKGQINGGVSGTGGMEVVPYPGVDYDTPLDPPTEGWITDQADADADGDLEYALDTWFAYDSKTHEVTPADIVYVVRTVEGNLLKLVFLGYYDEAGTPGYVHIHWGPLDDTLEEDTGDTGDTTPDDGIVCTADPERSSSATVDGVTTTVADTTSVEDWVCLDLESAAQVTEGWDLAMQKWTFPSTAEVAALAGQDWDALTVAPAEGYETDPELDGECFDDWYDYDATEHTLNPQDIVYVAHTAEGAYFKIQFLSYYPDGDTTQPHHPSFRWAPVAAPVE
jgi:hypothetical protein